MTPMMAPLTKRWCGELPSPESEAAAVSGQDLPGGSSCNAYSPGPGMMEAAAVSGQDLPGRSSSETCPPGPLADLAAALMRQGNDSGSFTDICPSGPVMIEDIGQSPIPHFTELRPLNHDSSWNSLELSASACSLSLLEGLEVATADDVDVLPLLSNPGQLGENSRNPRETPQAERDSTNASLEQAGKAMGQSFAEKHPLLPPPDRHLWWRALPEKVHHKYSDNQAR